MEKDKSMLTLLHW